MEEGMLLIRRADVMEGSCAVARGKDIHQHGDLGQNRLRANFRALSRALGGAGDCRRVCCCLGGG